MSAPRPPADLRRTVAADLRPVRPLRPAWQRALLLVPLAVLVWWTAHSAYGLRGDAARLGPWLVWGVALVQIAGGVGLAALALRLAVPGQTVARRSAAIRALLVLAWLAAVTLATWTVSPSPVPPGRALFFWRLCTSRMLLMALPLVAACLVLLRRTLARRPALLGAVCGFGAGLIVDAGWRTVCSTSAQGHVLDAHFLPIVVSSLLGAVGAAVVAARR